MGFFSEFDAEQREQKDNDFFDDWPSEQEYSVVSDANCKTQIKLEDVVKLLTKPTIDSIRKDIFAARGAIKELFHTLNAILSDNLERGETKIDIELVLSVLRSWDKEQGHLWQA